MATLSGNKSLSMSLAVFISGIAFLVFVNPQRQRKQPRFNFVAAGLANNVVRIRVAKAEEMPQQLTPQVMDDTKLGGYKHDRHFLSVNSRHTLRSLRKVNKNKYTRKTISKLAKLTKSRGVHNPKLIENHSQTKSRRRRADPIDTPTPETSASSEPETQPETEIKPETQPETEIEPEGDPNSTSEPLMWPEPEPDWTTAQEEWQVAWPLHVYGFATIFLLLCLVSLLELVRIHVKSRRKTALKVSLLLMIVAFSTTRAVALLVDPYGYRAEVNPIVARLLFSVGNPCIVSSMSLLLLVLIDTTRMNIAPPTFQRVQCIIAVVSFHLVLVVLTDVVVAFYLKAKLLILICQIYYLVEGLVLTTGYASIGYKIARNSAASVTRDKKMEKLKFLIGLASFTGLAMVGVTIYGAAGVFGIYADVKIVDAWPWWIFQTSLRLLEITMVIVLLLMNVNVSGAGLGLRQLLTKCRKNVFKNKIDVKLGTQTQSVSAIESNSWMIR